MSRRITRAIAILTVGVVALGMPSQMAAYNQNVYTSGLNISQETDCWCAVVTAKIMVKSVTSSFSTSQTTMNTYMNGKDKYNWGGCGHDPRGVAWAVYNYTPAGYYYNDYRYTSQFDADWEIVYDIRATNDAAGASVARGKHAVAVVGYNTTIDPFVDGTNSINGFYVVDPWYPHNYSAGLGSQWNPSAPPYGLPHDSTSAYYLTRSSWDSLFFYLDTNEGSFYNNYYVPYLRSTSGTPSDSPPETYGDWYYRTHLLGAVAGDESPAHKMASREVVVPEPTFTTLDMAVRSAIKSHELEAAFGLHGYSIGRTSFVQSLMPSTPSYELIVLLVRGLPKALAVVAATARGFEFVGIAPTSPEAVLTDRSKVDAAMARVGLHATGRLFWAQPDGSQTTLFEPYLEGVDANGVVSYLGARGLKTTHLSGG